jgi:hypothetical protein
MLFGNDMVYVKGKLRSKCREMAILAAPPGTTNYARFEGAPKSSHAF